MFDLVPFAGSWRKVADPQAQAAGVGQRLERLFPQPVATTVAAASVRHDQQFGRLRETLYAHLRPPAADAGCRECGRVMVDADTHPAFIAGQIIDTVGNSL